jgi:cytochrome P450
MPTSIVFSDTKDPLYPEKRKALSGAFFKSKLVAMTKTIKEVTLKEIKQIQSENKSEINLADLTLSLQSRIIVNVVVGMGYS